MGEREREKHLKATQLPWQPSKQPIVTGGHLTDNGST